MSFPFKRLISSAITCGVLLPGLMMGESTTIRANETVQNKTAQGDFVVQGGCIVRARAYIDKEYRPQESSRYSLEIMRTPRGPYQWDMTLDGEPGDHWKSLSGAISPAAYGTKQQATLRAVLHQYDLYEERVTFRHLDLLKFVLVPPATPTAGQSSSGGIASGFLSLTQLLTATTPSGITITLSVQGRDTFQKVFAHFNGNANALFIEIRTAPSQHQVVLPKSPLYRKHDKPIRLTLDCPPPYQLVSYGADNTSQLIAIGLPDLEKVRHLDALTLIVRQRVDVQSIPVAFQVPVEQTNQGHAVSHDTAKYATVSGIAELPARSSRVTDTAMIRSIRLYCQKINSYIEDQLVSLPGQGARPVLNKSKMRVFVKETAKSRWREKAATFIGKQAPSLYKAEVWIRAKKPVLVDFRWQAKRRHTDNNLRLYFRPDGTLAQALLMVGRASRQGHTLMTARIQYIDTKGRILGSITRTKDLQANRWANGGELSRIPLRSYFRFSALPFFSTLRTAAVKHERTTLY